MTPQRRKKIIIGTAILVICGVVGYFIYKKIKDSKPEEQPPAPAPDSSSGSNTSIGSGSNVGSGNQFTFPFKTTDEGNAFRAWVIAKDPQFAKSIDLSAKGPLNNYIQKAWDKYGAEYQKGTAPTIDWKPSVSLDEVQKNLGQGSIPVERYTDKVIARLGVLDSAGAKYYIAGEFIAKMVKNKPFFHFQVSGPGAKVIKTGYWTSGGKTITMKNGRVISSGSVWENIRTAWNS
jgi:hypothetical protein